jgi:hypothetical protein
MISWIKRTFSSCTTYFSRSKIIYNGQDISDDPEAQAACEKMSDETAKVFDETAKVFDEMNKAFDSFGKSFDNFARDLNTTLKKKKPK